MPHTGRQCKRSIRVVHAEWLATAILPEGTVVQAADGAEDVVVAVADGVVDQAGGGAVGADSASLPEGPVVRATDGAADVDVALADGVVDQAGGWRRRRRLSRHGESLPQHSDCWHVESMPHTGRQCKRSTRVVHAGSSQWRTA